MIAGGSRPLLLCPEMKFAVLKLLVKNDCGSATPPGLPEAGP